MKKPVENQTQIILDSIAEGVFTIDLDWRITSFNRAAEKITGIKKMRPSGGIAGRFSGPVYANSDAS